MSSEHGIKNLREELTRALTKVVEVLAILEGIAVVDARNKGGAVLSGDTDDSGGELAVLFHVIEGSQLGDDSVQVTEVAVTIVN